MQSQREGEGPGCWGESLAVSGFAVVPCVEGGAGPCDLLSPSSTGGRFSMNTG